MKPDRIRLLTLSTTVLLLSLGALVLETQNLEAQTSRTQTAGAQNAPMQNPAMQSMQPPPLPAAAGVQPPAQTSSTSSLPYGMGQAPIPAPPILPPASWSPADEKRAPPESMIYQNYFRHVGSLEQAAQQEDKQRGESGASPWRTHEQRVLGLTGEEGKVLTAVALDCNRELQFQDQKLAAISDAYWNHPTGQQKGQYKGQGKTQYRGQYRGMSRGFQLPPPEFRHLSEQRTQIIQRYIGQLKLSLGDATFQKLDRYVKWNFGGHSLPAMYPPYMYAYTNLPASAQIPSGPPVPEPAHAVAQPGPGYSPAPPPADSQLASVNSQPPPADAQPASDQPMTPDPAPAPAGDNEAPLTVHAGDVLPCPVDDDRLSAVSQQKFLTVDGSGNVYFTADFCVFKLDSSGTVTRVAGGGSTHGPLFGPATAVFLPYPHGLAVDPAGNLFIGLGGAHQIVVVTPGGALTTLASLCGRLWPSCSASINDISDPAGMASDSAGDIYIADDAGARVERISNGQVTTVAGTGTYGFSGDGGPATAAALNGPLGVAVDSGGNLYIADSGNQRIRQVLPDGTITTIAGAENGSWAEGIPALLASIGSATAVAVDSAGGVYIADTITDRVRKVIPQGFINTWVDYNGVGYRGNLIKNNHNPTFESLATDAEGNLYVYDARNEQIAKVSPWGEVSILARTITKRN